MKRERREPGTRGVWENTRWLLESSWQSGRRGVALQILRFVPQMLLPYLGVWMSSAVVGALTDGVGLERLLWLLGGFSLGLIALAFLDSWLDGRYFAVNFFARIRLMLLSFQKAIWTDYRNIASLEGQERFHGGFGFVNSPSASGGAVVLYTQQLLAAAGGLLLYGVTLASLHPLVFLGIAVTTLLGIALQQRVNHFREGQREALNQVENQLWYLFSRSPDVAAGKDVRLYPMREWLLKIFSGAIGRRMDLGKQADRKQWVASLLEGLLGFLRDALVYGYLIWPVLRGALPVDRFVLYIGLVGLLSTMLGRVAEQLKHFGRMSVECNRYRAFLDMPDDLREQGLPFAEDLAASLEVAFDRVSFSYPGAEGEAITELNETVRPGEKIAIVGANGAGKTTLMKLLCGLYDPDHGSVRIGGVESRAYQRDAYYRFFTAVFQEFSFWPISIAENIALGRRREIDEDRVRRCLAQADILEKVEALPRGIWTSMLRAVNEDAATFSGGEEQKLTLARALYRVAPILVLDEPTAALDPIAERKLYERYSDLTRGRTAFFISHRLSSTRFCDRVWYMEQGKIREKGSHEELMALGGGYARMYDVQAQYYREDFERGES